MAENHHPNHCSLCKKEIESIDIVGDFVYGGTNKQKFYQCSSCDVAFLYPPLSEDDEKKFYAGEFERFMGKRCENGFDWSGPEAHIKSNFVQYKRRMRFIEDLIESKKRVLEIGCSSGFMLYPLKEKGLDVVGVEPSSQFTDFLQSKGVPSYDSLDVLLNDIGHEMFDLTLHFFVLEHIRNPIDFLNDALKTVKPGGHLVFEIPSREDPLVSIYNVPAFHKFYWSVAHNYYFNRKSLEYILRKVAEKVDITFDIIGEQRYDLSNHITWMLEGKPGGQEKYSSFFTPELEKSYTECMINNGHCDTLIGRIFKKGD